MSRSSTTRVPVTRDRSIGARAGFCRSRNTVVLGDVGRADDRTEGIRAR